MELHGGHGERLVPGLPSLREVVLTQPDEDVLLPELVQTVSGGDDVFVGDERGSAVLAAARASFPEESGLPGPLVRVGRSTSDYPGDEVLAKATSPDSAF